MPKITALLLNYKRPQNISLLIQSIRKQTVPINIILWHNGVNDEIPGADLVLRSNRNMGCLVRWHMAALADTDYVFTLDDDLAFSEVDFIERCLNVSKQHNDTKIIGKYGIVLGKWLRKYTRGQVGKSAGGNSDQFADIVKGQFMFVPKKLLKKIPLGFPQYKGRGDDIWVSLLTGSKKEHHLLPQALATGIARLPGNGVGLSDKVKEHLIKREEIVATIIDKNYVAWLKPTLLNKLTLFIWRLVLWVGKMGDHRGVPPQAIELTDSDTLTGESAWVVSANKKLTDLQKKVFGKNLVALSGSKKVQLTINGKTNLVYDTQLKSKRLI